MRCCTHGPQHITCKIRLLHEYDDTLRLVQLIERTAVSAIAVHGRHKEQVPSHAS